MDLDLVQQMSVREKCQNCAVAKRRFSTMRESVRFCLTLLFRMQGDVFSEYCALLLNVGGCWKYERERSFTRDAS